MWKSEWENIDKKWEKYGEVGTCRCEVEKW